MLRRTTAIGLGLFGVLVCGCSQGASPQATAEEVVRKFVTPLYAEGVPYDGARDLGKQVGQQAESVLIRMIGQQDMKASQSNVVVTLGILGSADAAKRLIAFIEDGSGPLPTDEVQPRMDAVVALGYAANVAADATALNYLLSGADPAYWTPPRINWTLPDKGSPAGRLRTRTISALGLSGNKDAHQMLLKLQKTGGGGGRGGGAVTGEQALIAEALDANEYIEQNGLSKYYSTRRF